MHHVAGMMTTTQLSLSLKVRYFIFLSSVRQATYFGAIRSHIDIGPMYMYEIEASVANSPSVHY